MFLALVSSLVVAGLAAVAAPAQAGLISGVTDLVAPSCGTETQPFAPFGDSGWYYGVNNLGFESGSTAWSLSGSASIVRDNEPWYASGAGSHALTLGSGASATSAAGCINVVAPYLRLFADGSRASGPLQIQVIFRGLTGNLLGVLNYGSYQPGSYPGWRPGSIVTSLLALPLATTSMQLKLTSMGGTWRIDDIYVDPLRMG